MAQTYQHRGVLIHEQLISLREIKRLQMNYCDNLHYQYEQGFLDDDYYENQACAMVRKNAPTWRELGIRELRQVFTKRVYQRG